MSDVEDHIMYDDPSQAEDLAVLHDYLVENDSNEEEERFNYKRASADNLFERLNTVALSAKCEPIEEALSLNSVDAASEDITLAIDDSARNFPIEPPVELSMDESPSPTAVEATSDVSIAATADMAESVIDNSPSPTGDESLTDDSMLARVVSGDVTESDTDGSPSFNATEHAMVTTDESATALVDEYDVSSASITDIDNPEMDTWIHVTDKTDDSIEFSTESTELTPPPPAPTIASRPMVQGSMTQDDEVEDSDSDEEANIHNENPPLQLTIVDDTDELEVDTVVAEEIQRVSTGINRPSPSAEPNVLLNVLNHNVPMQQEKRDVQVAEDAHPDSSARMFGIEYQNMRKSHNQSNKYALSAGTDAFQELEHELTLTTDMSLQGNTDEMDDEFASSSMVEASSMERVHALLEKQKDALDSKTLLEAALLQEMRLATEAERVEIHSDQLPVESTENTLTLTELHTIYKNGFGDQEVLLLDETQEQVSAPVTQKIGAITEAEEDEDDDEEGTVSSVAPYEPSQDEWNEVSLHLSDPIKKAPNVSISTVTYEEALEYFMGSNEVLEDAIDRIVVEDFPAPSILPCFACLSPRPRLTFLQAIEQRERLFCIAATPLNPKNGIHIQLLQTIYRALMQTSRDVSLMGAHWEEIGFQGSDPATDLRGCGVLSLLQMVYLVDHHRSLALRFHKASQHKQHHFPMACALINITLHCLMALRSGALYNECNKQSSVFNAFNTLFIALTTELLHQVESSSEAFSIIMKTVLDYGRVHPDKLIRQVQTHPGSKKTIRESVNRKQQSQSNVDFTEIGLHSNNEE